jgi:hypothetical protein
MAETYYKFAERSAESQVNWAEVGRSVSEMLLEDAAIREQKKGAIDEASRQFGEVLSNAPTGEFKPANEWILDYANDATQAMLLQDRLLKQGALSLKDYTVQRQNINDSTNQMFEISKKYQDKFTEAKKRAESGIAQDTEMWLKTQAEGLSNFTNTKAYINPTNYQVSIAKMKRVVGSDGKEVMTMDDSPDGRLTINQLNNYLDINLDKYDYTKNIDDKVNSLGSYAVTEVKNLPIYRTYGITQIADPTIRAKFGIELTDAEKKSISTFEQWETATIDAQMANPFNQMSVLTDALDIDPKTGEEYIPTFDAALAQTSSKYILIEDNGSGMIQPKFTKDQDKTATEFMRTIIRNSIDQERKTDTQAKPSTEYAPEYTLTRGDETREKESNATYWNQLWWGDARQKTAAAQALLGSDIAMAEDLQAIDAKSIPGSIVLKYKDGSKNRTVKLSEFTPAEWAATGVELHGENDRNRAMNAGGGFQGKQVNTSSALDIAKREGGSAPAKQNKQTAQQQANAYLKKNLTAKMIKQTESIAVPQINKIIQPLGFTGEESGAGSYITITAKDGETSKRFSLNNSSGNQAVVNDIISWVQGNIDEKSLMNAQAGKIFDEGGGELD